MTIQDWLMTILFSGLLGLALYNHEKIKQNRKWDNTNMNFKKYLNNQNKLKSPIVDMVSSHVKHIVETDINYLINERVIQHEDRTKAALATISKDLEQIKALFKEILDKEQETPQQALNKIQDAKEQEIRKLVNLNDPTSEAATLVHKAIEDYAKHQQIQRIITEELNIRQHP